MSKKINYLYLSLFILLIICFFLYAYNSGSCKIKKKYIISLGIRRKFTTLLIIGSVFHDGKDNY